DIYTCGVLLFQLLTCRLPFEGETPLHTATLHIHQPPPRPSTYAPAIDARLEAVILKALSKKPADRHQTARHLGSTLRTILPEVPDVAVASQPTPPRGTFRRPGSMSLANARSISSPPPPDAVAPMESARTLVASAGAIGGPPPAIVLRDSLPSGA